ncbi:DUF2155 domain-containing protein [Croceicoccus bisphenolivorans]|uniref:DUF2155 domain-containing protein n=1 Tax=Croceicoccus bisphenolivorans TaxID=1783232 RepID=UPI001FE15B5E|nr:DUF2155 domain-containing protein [Croceicoccus bisphenolivorans]
MTGRAPGQFRRSFGRGLGLAALLLLAACGSEPEPAETDEGVKSEQAVAAPAETEKLAADAEPVIGEDGLPEGTPMAERVATLGLLNKRNNLTQDIELKPGEEQRVGDVLIRLATCERRPPWDPEPEEGAFVQVFTTGDAKDENPDWTRIFSGWLFLNSPSLNVVEHPIYDVWIKDCAMTFPGEEDAPAKD